MYTHLFISYSLVVFSSSVLPVSIVQTDDAEYVYAKLLGSELFAVPQGGPKRLADWPGLHAKQDTFNIKGIGWRESCADIVLSSAGKHVFTKYYPPNLQIKIQGKIK